MGAAETPEEEPRGTFIRNMVPALAVWQAEGRPLWPARRLGGQAGPGGIKS